MKITYSRSGMAIALAALLLTLSAAEVFSQETRVSGRMTAPDGAPLAGTILIEDGRLYGKNYRFGGAVGKDGEFSVALPIGGDYGLHLYATGHIYHPVGVEVTSDRDNRFEFSLPPNPAVEDAPEISSVRFDENDDGTVVIRVRVRDPNNDLSHQVLAANRATQEGLILDPPKFVFPWTKNYPNGEYTVTYDTQGRAFDPQEWLIVTADNRCYNSPVLAHPFDERGIVKARTGKKPEAQQTAETREPEAVGQEVFAKNCTVCHHADSRERKVGPGLQGLFQREKTPDQGIPVTEENIRRQIASGGEQMPPYAHIDREQLDALIAYLKTI